MTGRLPQPIDNLGDLEGYHSPQVDVAVRLNTNESPYPPPAGWLDALADRVRELSFHRYPDRKATALRRALADFHGVPAEQVFAANGSNEVLQTLFLTYGGPGRPAAVFEPTYAMHSQIGRVTSTPIVVGARRHDFRFDIAEAKRVLAEAEPAITFVCSPNNPTGGAEPASIVDEVLDLAPGLVVVDEAYGQFSSWSALERVADDRPLVVTRTYSKTWSMAGFRLGYLVGPAKVVAALEARVLPYHLDLVKQAAGVLALQFVDEMEDRVKAIVDERERLARELATMAVEVWPSDANFLLFRPDDVEGPDVWQALVDRSVLVRNCGSWPGLENCLRVTVGTPVENDRFLESLRAVFDR